MTKRLAAEFLGTLWLVLGGCGSAVLAAKFPEVGIGLVGVSFAFGLTVLTMAYAIGHVSGCHLNPAVTCGLVAAGRFPAGEAPGYIIAQSAGACAGAALLYVIVSGGAGFAGAGGFAANGFGAHSPGGFGLNAVIITEVAMTFFFLIIILGATSARAPAGFAPIPHRTRPHAHPFDQHSGQQHLGQSGPQPWAGPVRRGWLGLDAALGVLGRADRRCGARGPGGALAAVRR